MQINLLEDIKIGNLNDCWLKLYVYLAREIIGKFDLEGEVSLREGIRSFGHDRVSSLREEQVKLGMKLNMYNLWTYYDLPDDKRFKRNKIRLNTEERISQTLVCPMSNMWIEMGAKELGAIYCDEFHPAMFSGYHPKMLTNLGQTLTHDTDDHCHFALYLRPANMTKEERKQSFAKYDREFDKEKVGKYHMRTAREGYNMLIIKLYYHLAKEVIDEFGGQGKKVIEDAIRKWAEDIANFLRIRAEAVSVNLDLDFIEENCPISMNIEEDTLWKRYDDERNLKLLFSDSFYGNFSKEINL